MKDIFVRLKLYSRRAAASAWQWSVAMLATWLDPIGSLQLVNIHSRSSTRRTMNEAHRGWMPARPSRGANPGKSEGQTTRFQGNKSSLPVRSRLREGRQEGFFFFFLFLFFFFPRCVGFGWKDIGRSVLRTAGTQPNLFNAQTSRNLSRGGLWSENVSSHGCGEKLGGNCLLNR